MITNASPISNIEAMKNFAIIGVTSEFVGVFSAIMSMKTVSDNSVVMTKVTLSPVVGGRIKVKSEARVMSTHGTTRLFK